MFWGSTSICFLQNAVNDMLFDSRELYVFTLLPICTLKINFILMNLWEDNSYYLAYLPPILFFTSPLYGHTAKTFL